jgi:hypothetical protein
MVNEINDLVKEKLRSMHLPVVVAAVHAASTLL